MKYLIFALFLSISGILYAPALDYTPMMAGIEINPFSELFTATCTVESGNDQNAINEKEQAYGAAQIRQCKLTDYNRQTRNHYSLADCLDPAISRRIYMHFAAMYNPSELEQVSRVWNGGPRGMEKKSTVQYWNRILKNL